ncbi:hypothetical protein MBOVJF4428_00568 [Mycoplasmopsis agalactiae]|uniref:hypothetical protein n=1 Tax=Mycoplasmopsis agalactiae TaxID=2110 RepID=UPI000C7019A6|nr:hypothetical protein [Mycoplasmopsis agalactiae]SBO45533.1 hypothetical protein MBOVJF4428_00568 [Mycoplasmopsis agalactiae]
MNAIIQNNETTKKDALSENNPDIELFFKEQLKEFNEKISSLIDKKTYGGCCKRKFITFYNSKYEWDCSWY